MSPTASSTDIVQGGWIDRLLPRRLRAYARLMRLDRPIGFWLLLIPGWWSITLAGRGEPNTTLMILFLAGAVLMRGAGCTLNDIVDRDYDAKVARTRTRPIPAGEISVRAAFVFLAVQLAGGLTILLQFNWYAVGVGCASLILIAIYPFMKRITYWPQAWLGLTFNWGALLGWAAARGTIQTDALILYAGCFFWTLGYDTIYAHQDKDDDALIGVKSSALALGQATRPFVAACYVLAFALILTASWPLMVGPWPKVLVCFAAGHLAWQIKALAIDSPTTCLRIFKSNRDFGLLILAALLAHNLAYRVPRWVDATFFGEKPACIRYVNNPEELVCPE
ncbi:MAG: 4-hydroxybenzoate octaprenyltransferase [Rhodospirillaceae bacterium]